MTATESAARLGPYVERLLQNAYVQDNLLDAVENLREAYERAQKRRVEPARDEKIRRQLRQSALSLQKAGEALKSGRQKPKKPRAKRMLMLASLGAVGEGTPRRPGGSCRDALGARPRSAFDRPCGASRSAPRYPASCVPRGLPRQPPRPHRLRSGP